MGKLTIIILTLVLSGCVTIELPPPISHEEKQKIVNVGFLGKVVGVEKYKWQAHSDALIHMFRQTHLFRKVQTLQDLKEKPDYIVRLNEPIPDPLTRLDPFVGVLFGLGILFPTHSDECEYGYDFDLWEAARPDRKIRIADTFATEGFGGHLPPASLIGLRNLSPNWSMMPEESNRFLDHLRLKLIDSLENLESE